MLKGKRVHKNSLCNFFPKNRRSFGTIFPKKNRKGAERWLSPFWFAVLFFVAGFIAYIAVSFYGKPIYVKDLEANALTNKVADCLSDGGYLKEGILGNADFKNNFLKNCHLNFNVEDISEWKPEGQYYTEFGISKFNPDLSDDIGNNLLRADYGNPNLKTDYIIKNIKQRQALRKVDMVVIHYTADSNSQQTIKTLEERKLSIHYIIDKDGSILSSANTNSPALVSEDKIAGHAGCEREGTEARISCHSNTEKPDSSKYEQDKKCCMDVNSRSIGIEIVNLGDVCGSLGDICKNRVEKDGVVWEEYTPEQIDSLVSLVSGIAARYDIPIDREHIVGHEEVAPWYKTDPGKAFPWSDFMNRTQEEQKPISWAGRSFYALDKENNQYAIDILSVVRKIEKNEI